MVEVTPEASKYIVDLIEKNEKKGFGIKIYLSGMGCSGPQFGMTFQQGKKEGDVEQPADGFSLFYDNETKEVLDACTVDFIETPYGTGLIVHNPNTSGSCSSCGSGGCH
ncbi:MAG TPA: iron-sulfur cluster assembly accessory protein [Methanomassiliicoccales archaeon]|nr:iron-sulfur cluster assembly accessory protein [Methanomassiliicoccales archaeon]